MAATTDDDAGKDDYGFRTDHAQSHYPLQLPPPLSLRTASRLRLIGRTNPHLDVGLRTGFDMRFISLSTC